MRRVEAASGAKYSAHKEAARKFEPITPVGTNYTPIGQPDIAAMRRMPQAQNSSVSSSLPSNPRPPVSASVQKPAVPSAPRPGPASTSVPFRTAAATRAPADAWEDAPVSHPPPPPPAASRPPAIPSAPRPIASVSVLSIPLMKLTNTPWNSLIHPLSAQSLLSCHQMFRQNPQKRTALSL